MEHHTAKISALMITYNEVDHIEKAINNISFTDEIVIVDSFSSDGTLNKIKETPNVKVISKKFENFADQRNFAINQAKHEWILFLDADERITPELQKEIIKTINSKTNIVGFKFRRKNYFGTKAINFSGFQTDTIYRLFKNNHVSYQKNRLVHENAIVDGKTATLKNKLIHYTFSTYRDCKNKTKHYSKLKALELFNKGQKPSFLHFTIKPMYKFIFNYIFRLGILDGKEGFQICYLNAYGVYFRYLELKRLIKSSPKK